MQLMFAFSVFNQPLNNWDVSSVTDFSYMFHFSEFNQPLGQWDVSSAFSIAYMFDGASNFNQDLSGWCVSQFETEPSSFSSLKLTEDNMPNWGETCETLSLNQPKGFDFTIYPNPASDVVSITNETNVDIESYSLYDAEGRLVKSKRNLNTKALSIPVSDLSTGYYMLQVFTTDHQSQTQKLMVK
jgi:hypothetical protein